MAPDVLLYTKSYCPFCKRAKIKLADKGITNYREIDIEEQSSHRRAMIEASGGRTTVPQIFIDGKHIGGADDLFALDDSGELDRLLKAAET